MANELLCPFEALVVDGVHRTVMRGVSVITNVEAQYISITVLLFRRDDLLLILLGRRQCSLDDGFLLHAGHPLSSRRTSISPQSRIGPS
ncbi:hypothetical protein Tcan_09400 [Toxocara canis]|uniref:Uncharacterized protein n=1 Tax=Toxocara canis TaxID=6265 RepID=A0A0B2USP4_TOXCA|nr:hypothetical protein Tcan_09400 [Toxocara canis]